MTLTKDKGGNMSESKGKKKTVIIVAIILAIAAAAGAFAIYQMTIPEKLVVKLEQPEGKMNPFTGEYTKKELPVRPLLVSTDNVNEAIPQYGISQADMIYEVPVEGMQSRLECLYYSDMPEVVGPCRSVRSYTVTLAREKKAILTHNGWSPGAKKYLSKGHVADIPAQTYGFYYRTSEKPAPHNSLVKTKDVYKAAKEQGYLDKKIKLPAFSYFNEKDMAVINGTEKEFTAKYEAIAKEQLESPRQEYEIPTLEGVKAPKWNGKATKITVEYVNCKGEFTWNAKNGYYKRSVNDGEYRDLNNGKSVKVKNVIVYKVGSRAFDHKGRLDIDMTKGGKAWVFTQGKVIKCRWSKKKFSAPTIFKDKNGKRIKLTRGKTWLNMIDQNTKFDFK